MTKKNDAPGGPRRRFAAYVCLLVGALAGLLLSVVSAKQGSAAKSSAKMLEAELNKTQAYVVQLEGRSKAFKAQRDDARRELAIQRQLAADTEEKHTALEVEHAELLTRHAELETRRADLETQLTEQQQAAVDAEARAAAAEAAAEADAEDDAETPETCADRHTPWEPSAERDAKHPELAAFLQRVAVNNEVMVAVSNINYARAGGMLEVWMENVRRAGVENAMVLALDDATRDNVEAFGLPAFRVDLAIPDSQKNAGSNHAVSALKFRLLTPFVELGYAVLLSDVDIVTLKSPFEHLVRDSDVESLSDGWDEASAYGYNDVADDPSMGWARYAHSMRIFVFNSGLFYLRPTQASSDLLAKVVHRVESEGGWDQALFNECIFFPNSPRNGKDPAVTRRVMDINLFMNSKRLFKYLRHDAAAFAATRPVMIHVNYHPDKFERMKAVVRHYVDGEQGALDDFPDGSERPVGKRVGK